MEEISPWPKSQERLGSSWESGFFLSFGPCIMAPTLFPACLGPSWEACPSKESGPCTPRHIVDANVILASHFFLLPFSKSQRCLHRLFLSYFLKRSDTPWLWCAAPSCVKRHLHARSVWGGGLLSLEVPLTVTSLGKGFRPAAPFAGGAGVPLPAALSVHEVQESPGSWADWAQL